MINVIKFISIFLLCLMASVISGCVHTKATEIQYLTETVLPADDSWRCAFTEPALISLIETALKQNADIRIANLNVDQADAELKRTRLSWSPSLSAGVEAGISKANGSPANYTYNIPISMQWEVNIYGQLHQQKTDEALFWSAAERVRAVQIQIIASVASHYYTLVSLGEQRQIAQQNLELARQTLNTMEALKDAGLQNEAAINQARVEYLEAVSIQTQLNQQIQTTQNALSLLLGADLNSDDSASKNSQIVANLSLHHALGELPIPYQHTVEISALASRPDVRAAEYDLRAALENIDVAQSAFYPSINISATLGWTNNLGEIVNPGKVLFTLLGSIVQPLFNKGQNIANLRIAKARREQALIAFQQALLSAGSELADALNACQMSYEQSLIHLEQNQAAQSAYDISLELMKSGDANYLDVLTAQSALLQNKLLCAKDQLDIVQSQINLYKALGGTQHSLCQ